MFDDVWIIYYSTNNTERSIEAADLSSQILLQSVTILLV